MSATEERFAYVLDDEQDVGTVIAKMLVACGFYPRQFSDPLPFYAEIKSRSPDLVVLDLALGQSDAVEVIRQLEILQYSGEVLLISGRDETVLEKIKVIGKTHGLAMLPSLQKPFRIGELRRSLNTTTKTSTRQSAAAESQPKMPAIDLGEALHKRWLELWYQPKINLKTLKVSGAEALLRARHPECGIMLPASLLPPPSDPLYQPLTNFVIQQALADWTYFAEQGLYVQLTVNVPLSVLRVSDFIASLRPALPNDPRFPGLVIEITEDEVTRDLGRIQEIAAQLRLYNISLSIDDFGSGYSSLARLQDLPCSEIKLDRSFVLNCSVDGAKQALCSAAVDLAHSFGVTVCAEGVENVADLRTLIDLRCDSVQGFLFSQALPYDKFLEHLRTPSVRSETLAIDESADALKRLSGRS